MLLVADWLEEYLPQEVEDSKLLVALEKAGIEVENVHHLPLYDKKIVVARISRLRDHPNADNLSLATIEMAGKKLEVVCGAKNINVGQKVAYAGIGAKLPNGQLIKEVKIRGHLSPGMLLSEQELGLSGDHSGIMQLDQASRSGTPIRRIMSKGMVIDIKTAANRSDLNGVLGVAREIAAQTNLQLKSLGDLRIKPASANHFHNQIRSQVPRYSLAKLKLPGALPPTPDFIKRRLILSGIRSVNLLVDVTNYVMLETAQPLHVFDSQKVSGQVVIRRAAKGEQIKTLDGCVRQLSSQDIVIADRQSVVGLAGVIGGQHSEVKDTTREFLLEAANFRGLSIRQAAQRQNLRTEASARFERGLPPELTTIGLSLALKLYVKYAHAQVQWLEDELNARPRIQQIQVQPERLSQLAGFKISTTQVGLALSRLGFMTKDEGPDLKVTPPYWRLDVKTEEDIFEEVIKITGLDRVKATLPVWRMNNFEVDQKPRFYRDLRGVMAGLGLNEVMAYPFINSIQAKQFGLKLQEHIKIQNPLTVEQTHLTSSLLPNLLKAIGDNSRLEREFGFFEIDRVFSKVSAPSETTTISVLLQSPRPNYLKIKNILDTLTRIYNLRVKLSTTGKYSYLQPGRVAEIKARGRYLGHIGEVSHELSRVYKIQGRTAYLEIDTESLYKILQQKYFEPISRYQPITRDITVELGQNMAWADIATALSELKLATVEYIGDYYRGQQRLLTLRVKINTFDNPPSEDDVLAVLAKVESILARQFQAKIQTASSD